MKKMLVGCLLIFLLWNCKEKYVSPAITPATGYLVVEGVINAGTGLTNIVLKRTTKLDSAFVIYESGATVFVEGENNTQFNLLESSAGNYSSQGLSLNNAIKYRLNILTLDGKKYQSDFVSVQSTPPIDSVSWKQDTTGVQLYINTHDPTNQTKYYQWDYTETWEYHSPFLEYFKLKQINTSNGLQYEVVYLDPQGVSFDTTIIKCWPTANSTNILLGSTVSLSDNKIMLPLNFIPASSVKINYLYSILTRQYSLSVGKYQFLQKMKKNTESTGSVFDAQPSELVGNIHCINNPAQPVVGYIDICQVKESRTFISKNQLRYWDYKTDCLAKVVLNNIDSITSAQWGGFIPAMVHESSTTGGIISFIFSTPACVNCTLLGTNIKPVYWP